MSVECAGQNQHCPQQASSQRWAQIWRHRELLLKVARRHGADTDEAEDAAQEAMLRAAEHPEIADERLQAWLVAVTTRLCMDLHRRRAKEATRWQRACAQAVVQQAGQHPEEQACERSEAAWVAALATELLPPRQVTALQLTAAGCDVQEVATQLGVRYRAAESLLARARRTLRTIVTASLGVLAWTWRVQLPAAGHPIPVALASAVTATMVVVVLPPVIKTPQLPDRVTTMPAAGAPRPPVSPAVQANPAQVARTPTTAERPPPRPPRPPLLSETQPLPVLPTNSLEQVIPLSPPELPQLPPVIPLGRLALDQVSQLIVPELADVPPLLSLDPAPSLEVGTSP